MTTEVSQALSEITNLKNASIFHRRNCTDPDCGVSLLLLSVTAKRLLSLVPPREKREAQQILRDMGVE